MCGPEPTRGSFCLPCDGGCGGSGHAVRFGGWGVSVPRRRGRGGGRGAGAWCGLPHVRGDGGPGGEAEATPLRGGTPPEEQPEAPVQVGALVLQRLGAGQARGDPSSGLLGTLERGLALASIFLGRKGHFPELGDTVRGVHRV